jgi:hypothetical protein
MDANRVKIIAVSIVALGTMSAPTVSSAQSDRYASDDRPAVVVECGPGQRAVLEQRRVDSGTLVARCVTARVATAHRAPRRSKTKTALMIAGSTATGAGVGGALKGKKGALIGAAVGGGAASIYESAKRR